MIWRSMTPLAHSTHWIVRGSRNAQPCFPLTEIGRRGPKSPLDIPLVHRPSQKRRDILTPPLLVAVVRGRSPTRPPSLPMLSAWELIGFFLIRKTRGDRASVKGRTRGESEKEREREAAPSGLGHTYAYVLRTTQIHGTNAAPRRGCPCVAVRSGQGPRNLVRLAAGNALPASQCTLRDIRMASTAARAPPCSSFSRSRRIRRVMARDGLRRRAAARISVTAGERVRFCFGAVDTHQPLPPRPTSQATRLTAAARRWLVG